MQFCGNMAIERKHDYSYGITVTAACCHSAVFSSLKTVAWKRRSVPLKQSTPEGPPFEEEGDDEEHDAEQMRKQRIQEAFHLLASCAATFFLFIY